MIRLLKFEYKVWIVIWIDKDGGWSDRERN